MTDGSETKLVPFEYDGTIWKTLSLKHYRLLRLENRYNYTLYRNLANFINVRNVQQLT